MVLTSVILSDSEGSPRRNVEMLRFAQHDSNHHLHCVEALGLWVKARGLPAPRALG